MRTLFDLHRLGRFSDNLVEARVLSAGHPKGGVQLQLAWSQAVWHVQ
jgi:hypothetical protein